MYLIRERNVNGAYLQGLLLLHSGEMYSEQPSRNGPVRVANEPVCTHYVRPQERVLFSAQRDANPFFHLFEALWMLSGANDVALPAYFVPRMAEFSDNGTTFHAAYGYRWRNHFGPHAEDAYAPSLDQLPKIIQELTSNPYSRRVILQMWDPAVDLGRTEGRDLPCNVAAKFEIGSNGCLNMTVFNRSNDIVLGCYGANVVQFSMLQEYLAAHIGVDTGWYEQISCNFHAYTDSIAKVWPIEFGVLEPGYEKIPSDRWVSIEPLVANHVTFDDECKLLLTWVRNGQHVMPPDLAKQMYNPFFYRVAAPMLWAFGHHRQLKDTKQAIRELEMAITTYGPIDWLIAGKRWLERRVK